MSIWSATLNASLATARYFARSGARTASGAVTGNGIYKVVAQWAHAAGIEVDGLGVHGLRATAATKALEHDADIGALSQNLTVRLDHCCNVGINFILALVVRLHDHLGVGIEALQAPDQFLYFHGPFSFG